MLRADTVLRIELPASGWLLILVEHSVAAGLNITASTAYSRHSPYRVCCVKHSSTCYMLRLSQMLIPNSVFRIKLEPPVRSVVVLMVSITTST